MRIRIKTTPREREIDGIRLQRMEPGSIREMPATIANWLIANGYAEPELRTQKAADGTKSARRRKTDQ